MLKYKKILNAFLEDNKEILKEYAGKIGVIPKNEESYEYLENKCFRLLYEFDKLAINFKDGSLYLLLNLYNKFKDDPRVQFWVYEDVLSYFPAEMNIWTKNPVTSQKSNKIIYDYGDYRLEEKINSNDELKQIVLVDDRFYQNNNLGLKSGMQKEKRLYEITAKYIQKSELMTISTFDESSLIYIKGLLSGFNIPKNNLLFALDESFQSKTMQEISNDGYNVLPIVTIEKDKNWSILKYKFEAYQEIIINAFQNK